MRCALLLLALALLPGCAARSWFAPRPVAQAENPLFVSVSDREFLWNTLVDTIDDNFKIQREERVRLLGGILTEGRIDTFYTPGATYLEPWRSDSTPGYEKLHSTLQTIRRRCTARVTPAPGGFLIEIIVDKELEDLDRPEQATAGQSTLRHDGTIVRMEGPIQGSPQTLGWIPLGRDASLEQRMLLQLRAKYSSPGPVTSPVPAGANPGAYVDTNS
jgi:hypothetical protein